MPREDLFETEPEIGPEGEPLEVFASLSEITQLVGYALAWLHEPVVMRTMANRLGRAGIRIPGGRRYTNMTVRAALQDLHRHGLTMLPKGSSYIMYPIVSHQLVAQVYQNAELLAQLREFPLSDDVNYGEIDRYHRYQPYAGGDTGQLRAIRDLRELYYEGDYEALRVVQDDIDTILQDGYYWKFVLYPLEADRLRGLPADLFLIAMKSCRSTVIEYLHPAGELLVLMVERAESPEDWRAVGELALYRADWKTAERAERALSSRGSKSAEVAMRELRGAQAFLRGDDKGAVSAFEESMELWRKLTRKRKCCPPGMFGVWFIAALLRRGDPEDLVMASEYAKRGVQMHEDWYAHFRHLEHVADIVGGREMDGLREQLKRVAPEWLADLECGLHDLWFFMMSSLLLRSTLKRAECVAALNRLCERAEQSGALWLAAEAASLRDAWDGKPSEQWQEQTVKLWAHFGPEVRAFTTSARPPKAWERTVLALETLSHEFGGKEKKRRGAKKKGARRKQLVWCLQNYKSGWNLQPIERSVSAGGKVSKGRRVALKRLKERNGEMPHLTDQDRRVVVHIARQASWRGTEYVLANPKALMELAGHPLIFSDEEGTMPLELAKVSPRLVVDETKTGKIKLTLTPETDYRRAGPELIVESSTRYLVLDRTEVHVRLFELLNHGADEIPAEAKERVVKALGQLAEQLTIESDEETLGEVGIATVEADGHPVLRLYPHGEGLHARLLMRPLAGTELTCEPGEGKATIVAMQDGRQVQVRRDLDRERAAASEILEGCPTFVEFANLQDERWSALLANPHESLRLMEELQRIEPETLTVEWPEGESIRLHAAVEPSRFELSLGGSKDWLTASGNLRLDDDLVLTMRQLLDLMADSTDTPGFVRLKDGQFIALTSAFRRQLEDLRAFSQPGKGEKLRIHPLAALALEDLTEHPAVKVGAAWKEQLDKIREGASDELAEPPSTLQAELRPYQLEGYRWLRRLAEWGMGACLADDMGLGKTVQALAVLLDRAPDGPALVVAPTSVAANWLEEAVRFAPTLQPVIFGRHGEDRGALLRNAGPFDLVIASYGLLQSEEEAFAELRWHTVILDEAQAIKNRATKRSKAVMKLQADFRIITTGTPVENRLAELHNLFSFINPGLLGSEEKFRKSLADPIERKNDAEARDRLRRLIRPFLLRRLKSEVLRDLPSRTEISLEVELSPEEAAFYEALRQKAVDELAQAKETDTESGQAAIRILAHLMRLRRACCHPKLVDPETPLASSKLRVFAETLEEILAGNHKVLVFSQFVGHLHLIRDHLDEQGIAYQYLDGSTPATKRQKAVRAFQSGSGEVFLISLKAGGFGLNLTAADYVIHMDPWWNPATEDQASDRAHRIGQTRPVTIYRLITVGTIEEKIVDLHHRKRDLADSILEGTDSAGRMTPDELLELLRSDAE